MTIDAVKAAAAIDQTWSQTTTLYNIVKDLGAAKLSTQSEGKVSGPLAKHSSSPYAGTNHISRAISLSSLN